MAELTGNTPEEKAAIEAQNQALIDDHLNDQEFVTFLTEAENGTIDLSTIRNEKILKYIDVYDNVADASEEITNIFESKVLNQIDLGEIRDKASGEIKRFLLEKAKENVNSASRYIEKVRTYKKTLEAIAQKEAEIAALGNKLDLDTQKAAVNTVLGEATTKQGEFDQKMDENNKSWWNNIKRAGNFIKGKGFESAQDKKVASEYRATRLKEEIPTLNAKLAEIDGKLASITNATAEKAALESTIGGIEQSLFKDVKALQEVKDLMLQAAKDRLMKAFNKLDGSSGNGSTGDADSESSITLDDFAEAQSDYSMWEQNPMFREFGASDKPEPRMEADGVTPMIDSITGKPIIKPTLGEELQNILEVALNNELDAVEANNVGSRLEKAWSTIQSILPSDQAKSKKAILMIKETLNRKRTEYAGSPEKVKLLYINRLIDKIRKNY